MRIPRLPTALAAAAAGVAIAIAAARAEEPAMPPAQKAISHPLIDALVGSWTTKITGSVTGAGTATFEKGVGGTALLQDEKGEHRMGASGAAMPTAGHGVYRVSEDGRTLARHCREVADALEGALARIRDWPLEDRGFRAIGKGLKRTYRSGRLLMETALAEPSDANLHEWRKRVKDHWYHVRLLRNLWPRVLDAYRWEMKALSEALGDDHDLALLAPVVLQEPDSFGGVEVLERFTEFLWIHRRELQDQARLLGRRIYAEKPGLLVARFESRW